MATACETAHCMVPLAGVTEKFSAERQKVAGGVVVAAEAASTWTLPVMWVASGVAPRPATSV